MEEYYIDQNINFKVHIEENIKSKKLSKNKKEKNNKNTNNKIYKSNLNKVSNNKKDILIQMLLYISYIFFYCKIKNDNKSNPPKIQKFEIEEEEEDESNYKSSKIKNDSDGIKKNFEIYIDNNNKYENNNLNYSKDKNDKYNEDKNNLRNINTIENINIDKNKESINKDKLILQSNINNYNNFEYNTIEESNTVFK